MGSSIDLEALLVTKICLIWEKGAAPSSPVKNPPVGILGQGELCLFARLVHQQNCQRQFVKISELPGWRGSGCCI